MMSLPRFRRPHKPLPPREQWEALRRDAFARSNGVCQCAGDCGAHRGPCGAAIHAGPGGFECDHILPRNPRDPRIAPGPDVAANLRACCIPCNQAKSNRVTALPDGPVRRRLVTAWLHLWLAQERIGLRAAPLEPLNCPHMVTYRLEMPAGDADPPRGTASEVLAALRKIGQPVKAARVTLHAGVLSVEVPRHNPPPIALRHVPCKGLAIGVGIDGSNRPVVVDLASNPPHLAIAGESGSGKSTVIRTIALGFARGGGRLILCDSDADTWAPFAHAAALECAIAETREDIDAAVALAYGIMDARRGMTESERKAAAPVLLAIDEVQGLADGDQTAMGQVRKIAAHGRKFRVFVAVATQHPTAKYFERGALVNCRRMSGRVVDASASKAALGLAQAGAERLTGKGDMIVRDGGQLVRFRACLPVAADFATLPRAERKAEPAPRVGKAEDARHRKADASDRVAYAAALAQAGERPTGYKLNQVFGRNNSRNHAIAADVRNAYGMG